ncbi:hypothetical protein PFUGPA_00500 [Plasmodium falciparum Palo Alto/Uganda]|uniref:Uncharacterized protein n=2 Tax=Plasmodium falciparum TaxID=5833 RepID=W4J6E8_PLAFP|nr:hypothetical protein PFUGPA_00500 [Plasmodium falciparum Palo Alto/Uganda]ETW63411.1 hypothetical protein PFMC_00750 [Plasmodium falciparum CAMP/Malaysia]
MDNEEIKVKEIHRSPLEGHKHFPFCDENFTNNIIHCDMIKCMNKKGQEKLKKLLKVNNNLIYDNILHLNIYVKSIWLCMNLKCTFSIHDLILIARSFKNTEILYDNNSFNTNLDDSLYKEDKTVNSFYIYFHNYKIRKNVVKIFFQNPYVVCFIHKNGSIHLHGSATLRKILLILIKVVKKLKYKTFWTYLKQQKDDKKEMLNYDKYQEHDYMSIGSKADFSSLCSDNNGYEMFENNYRQDEKYYEQDGKNYEQDGNNYEQDGKNYEQDGKNYEQDEKNYEQDEKNYEQDEKFYEQDEKFYEQDEKFYEQTVHINKNTNLNNQNKDELICSDQSDIDIDIDVDKNIENAFVNYEKFLDDFSEDNMSDACTEKQPEELNIMEGLEKSDDIMSDDSGNNVDDLNKNICVTNETDINNTINSCEHMIKKLNATFENYDFYGDDELYEKVISKDKNKEEKLVDDNYYDDIKNECNIIKNDEDIHFNINNLDDDMNFLTYDLNYNDSNNNKDIKKKENIISNNNENNISSKSFVKINDNDYSEKKMTSYNNNNKDHIFDNGFFYFEDEKKQLLSKKDIYKIDKYQKWKYIIRDDIIFDMNSLNIKQFVCVFKIQLRYFDIARISMYSEFKNILIEINNIIYIRIDQNFLSKLMEQDTLHKCIKTDTLNNQKENKKSTIRTVLLFGSGNVIIYACKSKREILCITRFIINALKRNNNIIL